MKIPKTITGLAIIGLGGLSSMVPIIGAVISPAIIKVGEAISIWGATAKVVRGVKEKSISHKTILKHEINLLKGGKK